MAVEAARDALAARPRDRRARCSPPPARPTPRSSNAATLHAALDLPEAIAVARDRRLDARRALRAAARPRSRRRGPARARGAPPTSSIGAPGGTRESGGGDAAAASSAAPTTRRSRGCVGRASATDEFLDIWRLPEERVRAPVGGALRRRGARARARRRGEARARATRASSPSELATVILDATQPARHRGPAAALAAQARAARRSARGVASAAPAPRTRACCSRARSTARSPATASSSPRVADGADAARARGHRRDRARAGRAHASTRWIDVEAQRPRLQHLSQVARDPAVRAAAPARSGAPRRRRRCSAASTGSSASSARAAPRAARPAAAAARVRHVRRDRPDGRRSRSPTPTCRIATYTLDHLAYSLQPPIVAAVRRLRGRRALSRAS